MLTRITIRLRRTAMSIAKASMRLNFTCAPVLLSYIARKVKCCHISFLALPQYCVILSDSKTLSLPPVPFAVATSSSLISSTLLDFPHEGGANYFELIHRSSLQIYQVDDIKLQLASVRPVSTGSGKPKLLSYSCPPTSNALFLRTTFEPIDEKMKNRVGKTKLCVKPRQKKIQPSILGKQKKKTTKHVYYHENANEEETDFDDSFSFFHIFFFFFFLLRYFVYSPLFCFKF